MFDLPAAEERQRAWRAAALAACRRSAVGRHACRQGFVLTRDQARAAGVTAAEVRRFVRRGEWTAPRRGVLCVLPRKEPQSPVHGLRPEILAAAAALVRPGSVISHDCAALAHGLDVLVLPRIATLTTAGRRDACVRRDVVARAARLDEVDVTRWFGAPITTAARTVVDIARRDARAGIVVADSALRNEMMTLGDVDAALGRQGRWDGARTARRVLGLASALSESALESLVRLFMADHAVPLPEQQRWIETHRGSYRVDGLWERPRAILEADGLGKYERSGSLISEKLRQEALERAGYRVVRVTWADIHDEPDATLARIRAALGGGGQR